MKQIAPLAAAILLAACQADPASDSGNAAQNASAAAPATEAAAPAAARKVEEKSELLEFSYSWPAEAAAIPGLAKQFEEELGRDRVEAQATAKEDNAGHKESGTSFFAHSFSKEWRLAGNTPRLLSLVGTTSSFTGGAHPNTDYDGLIWDRQAGRVISLADLFAGKGAIEALSARYCNGLDAARAEKRGEALPPSPDDFSTACPPIAEQSVVAADTNGNGRFDMLQVWIPPSVAGAYAEGDYQVDLKMDEATLAALKPEYRAAFER